VINAATIMVELVNLRRFVNPRQMMGYLVLMHGESSTGDPAARIRLWPR